MHQLTTHDPGEPLPPRDDFAHALAEVVKSLVSFDSIEELSGALEQFGGRVSSDSAHILEHVPVAGTSGFFWQQAGWTVGSGRFTEHDPLLQEIAVDQSLPHMWAETVRDGYSLATLPDVAEPERVTLPSMHLRTLLTVRLNSGDRLWGVLALGWRESECTLNSAEIEALRHAVAPLGIIIERSRGARAIQMSLDRYRMLTETIKDVVWVLDVDQMSFTYVSPSVLGLRGFTHQEVMFDGVQAAMGPDDLERVQALAADGLARYRSGGPVPTDFVTAEVRQPCKDGSWVWTEAITRFNVNERTGRLEVIGVSRDITERKRLEEALKREAATDELTRIANRREFLRIAGEEIARSRRYGHELALCLFDIDDLKAINDRLGHAAGDAALRHFADNLRHHTRAVDTAARIGGDEYGLLLPETGPEGALSIICRIAQYSLDEPLAVGDEALTITAASGFAVLAAGDAGIEALIARADADLYEAKGCQE